jgi:hypothetical protein
MPATPTRPRLEQIRFTSSKTGTHNIDTYLEAAEIGNRTLASMMADLFDAENNGDFNADLFNFRTENGVLQFRVGVFTDATTGWQNADFRTLVGEDAVTFPMASAYASQSLFLLGSKLYISNTTIQYASQSAFDAGEAASEVTELFDAASLTTAELDAAVAAAQAARDDAEDATINNADFNNLVARLTDIQNLANPAANRTALEAFGDSYAADNASNAITGLNAVGNNANAVTGLANLKDSATPLANLSNSSTEINRLGATQNIVDAVELLGDNQTRIDAIDALGDATTSAAIDRLNQTDTSSPNSPQDTTADYIDALGTATMVAKLVALHNALTDINALASRTTEIDALGDRTAEIDALYAIRADIDAIGDTATLNDISTVAGMSTSNLTSINQDLGTTDSPTFDAITVDTIDPDPANNGTPLTIAGNLIVSGTTTTVNSNTVNIGDSIITLNSDETGVPSQNAGFEVERGSSANVSFVWDEANDRFTTNGQDLAASTFVGPLTGDVTGNADTATAWETPRTVQLTGDVTGTALNVDGSANITINTSMANDSVDLGTHTTGNYVGEGATSGNGLTGSLSGQGGTFTVTSNATDANTPSTIVYRDASGDFAAGTITADGLNLGDNEKVQLGASNDLQIYAVSGNSYIQEGGSGSLSIRAADLLLRSPTDENYLVASNNGAVTLYYDDAAKFATTSTGVDVTGNLIVPTVYGGTSVLPTLTLQNTSGNSNHSKILVGNVVASDNGGISLYTAGASVSTERVRISGTSGNVGIGTTNPQTALDVTGTITADGLNLGDNEKVQLGASNDLQIYHDGVHSYIADVGDGVLFLRGNDNVVLESNSGSNYFEGTSGGASRVYYAGNEKLATTSTGVDVTGAVTADGLTVDGATTLTGQLRFDNTNYWINNSGGNDISYRSGGTHQFYSGGFTERLNIASNGDISFYEDTGTTAKFFWDASAESLGIGTTSPGQELHVQSGSGLEADIRISGNGGASSYMDLFHNAVAAGVWNASNTPMQFGTNGTERMRISSSGNVGIGTTTPATALDVTGTVTADTFSFANWTVTESGGSLYFATGGTNKMKLDASGNLQVVGNVESNATIS